jgi:hypothetical protein
MQEKRGAYRVLVGKPVEKRPFGRPGGGWKYNIRMDLTEIGWEDVIWISQFLNGDRWRAFVDTVMKLQVA